MSDTVIDMVDVINLFDRMQTDARDNGLNMFNANDENVNGRNMISYFYQFIRKYIVVTKSKNDIINV
jgi:hypothetical protein